MPTHDVATRPASESARRPIVRWWVPVVAALLALHAWLAFDAATRLGVTVDEPFHLMGGYSYWTNNDYRFQPENGNLPQRWAALPLLFVDPEPRLPSRTATPDWARSDVFYYSYDWLYRSGNPPEYLLLLGRTMIIAFSVATGLLVWALSRRFWGDGGGVFSLGLFAVCPTFLTHGGLVTSDMCATLFLALSSWLYWRCLLAPTRGRASVSAAVFGLACVAKFSAVLLLPVMAVLFVLAVFHPAARDEKRGRRAARLLAWTAAHGVAAWAIIWTFYGWRQSAVNPAVPPFEQFYLTWDFALSRLGPTTRAVLETCRDLRVLPEAFVYGFTYVLQAATMRGAFLNGQTSDVGWWYFFPYAFLVKTPLAQLAAFLTAGCLAVIAWFRAARGWRARLTKARDGLLEAAPLVVLFVIYWAVSLASNLNIGHRHLMPTYPALFVLAGAIWQPAATRLLRAVGLGLLAWAVSASLPLRPNYIAHFNVFAGGPGEGYRHLVDSSLDWGQDLPALAAWLERSRKPGEPLFLSYFGSDSPEHAGLEAREIAVPATFRRPNQFQRLEPGLFAISATQLQHPYSPVRGPWDAAAEAAYQAARRRVAAGEANGAILRDYDLRRFARLCLYLRGRRPDGRAGYGILIYRLGADELRLVGEGSLAELAEVIERRLKAEGDSP